MTHIEERRNIHFSFFRYHPFNVSCGNLNIFKIGENRHNYRLFSKSDICQYCKMFRRTKHKTVYRKENPPTQKFLHILALVFTFSEIV